VHTGLLVALGLAVALWVLLQRVFPHLHLFQGRSLRLS